MTCLSPAGPPGMGSHGPYGTHQPSAENREGVARGGPATGTDVPVKRVELAPTRHPLGMLIKAKVLHICGNLHSFFFSASLTSASSQQILHFILCRLGIWCWRRGEVGGGLLLFEKLFLGHVIRQPATRCCHSYCCSTFFFRLPFVLLVLIQPKCKSTLCNYVRYSFRCKKNQNIKLLNFICHFFSPSCIEWSVYIRV